MPESAEELKKMLFGEQESICEYAHLGSFTTQAMADVVFDDIIDQKSRSDKEIQYICGSEGYLPYGDEDYEDMGDNPEEYSKDQSLLNKLGGKLVFFFEFSDDDAFGTTMEHGDIFNKLPNQKFSKH